MPGFAGAALDVFIRSPVLVNYTAKVDKLVNFFDVFLVKLDGSMLFVVDSHDFCLGLADLEPSLLAFFSNSVEFFLDILMSVGQEGDVVDEIQVLELFSEGPLDPCPLPFC